jgi:hypothetical protein
MSLAVSSTDAYFIYDSVSGCPLDMPSFTTFGEVTAFLDWWDSQSALGVMPEVDDIIPITGDLRQLRPSHLEGVRKVWARVWAGMEANPDHEHSPGCQYRAVCTNCDWRGNWGDHDNAFWTGGNHDERYPLHRAVSVHK